MSDPLARLEIEFPFVFFRGHSRYAAKLQLAIFAALVAYLSRNQALDRLTN